MIPLIHIFYVFQVCFLRFYSVLADLQHKLTFYIFLPQFSSFNLIFSSFFCESVVVKFDILNLDWIYDIKEMSTWINYTTCYSLTYNEPHIFEPFVNPAYKSTYSKKTYVSPSVRLWVWYTYLMVAQNTLRPCEGNRSSLNRC